MELSGPALYGEPCRECGYTWDRTPEDAIRAVGEVTTSFVTALADAPEPRRHPDLGWSTAGYLRHVADNLETWAYRLDAARLDGRAATAGYDPDALAAVQDYEHATVGASLLALRRAVPTWSDAVEEALAADVVLDHATRGPQSAADVARNNAHDALHHLHDVQRILAG
ncbi:DinB family protein [Cellulomonas triticagri]|uniref:DinB family protein n=1 Tax=Cellulomonas triticagri TaxID=2483352 RepID=A0A3M2JTW9_9CELL|nr:DinB family protein [Cellulomonas triticagri]RMI13608.1 DinB family protein [Cellulomonas triticagri]